MGLPSVNIELQNGGLGLVTPSDDRVVALVINGVADRPLQIFSVKDTANHASAANADYSAEYLRQIADFYKVAGEGAELWVLPVSPLATTTFLFAAGGEIENLMQVSDGRINVIGFSRFVSGSDSPTLLTGLEADMLNALDDAQAFANAQALLHKPVRIIMDGSHFGGDPAIVPDLKMNTYNRVGICLASNKLDAKHSAMGLLLGRIASIPVNRHIGRVKDGQVPTDVAFLTNGQTVKEFGLKATALHNKGYIFLRSFVGKAGYYWSDDHMATSDTDDYYSLSNGRTIDKASRLAYATYLEELNDTVLVDESTGKIVPTALKHYQGIIERAIDLTMTANGEISGVKAFVDPSQDILATSRLVVDLRITPTATNRTILVRLGLNNPLANN